MFLCHSRIAPRPSVPQFDLEEEVQRWQLKLVLLSGLVGGNFHRIPIPPYLDCARAKKSESTIEDVVCGACGYFYLE